MIISEQEKNRIRALHKQYSIINEQGVAAKMAKGIKKVLGSSSGETLKTLLHEWIDWIRKNEPTAVAMMGGCDGTNEEGLFPPKLTTKFPKWEKLKDAALAVLPSKKGILPDTFAQYLCTAFNKKYNGDWDIIDPKFPEFKF